MADWDDVENLMASADEFADDIRLAGRSFIVVGMLLASIFVVNLLQGQKLDALEDRLELLECGDVTPTVLIDTPQDEEFKDD